MVIDVPEKMIFGWPVGRSAVDRVEGSFKIQNLNFSQALTHDQAADDVRQDTGAKSRTNSVTS